jgi:hypothetical protein
VLKLAHYRFQLILPKRVGTHDEGSKKTRQRELTGFEFVSNQTKSK